MKIIFFDGNCILCNNFIKLIIKLDKKNILKFSFLDSDFAQKSFCDALFQLKKINSVVFLEDGLFYYKSKAVLRILNYLKFPFNLLFYFRFVIPTYLGDLIYDFIAKNRNSIFGKSKKCNLNLYDSLKEKLI